MMEGPQQPYIQPTNAAFNPYQQQKNYVPAADPEANFFDQLSNQQQQQQ